MGTWLLMHVFRFLLVQQEPWWALLIGKTFFGIMKVVWGAALVTGSSVEHVQPGRPVVVPLASGLIDSYSARQKESATFAVMEPSFWLAVSNKNVIDHHFIK
jgi:hypothetical protein